MALYIIIVQEKKKHNFMIDTHTHIYLEEFDEDRSGVVQRAREAGVTHLILPNVDMETIGSMHRTKSLFPTFCSMAMGLHPTSVNEDYRKVLSLIRQWFDREKYCAIGEIGMDLYWDKTFVREQKLVFAEQCEWAAEMGLPVIIHCRYAFVPIMEVLRSLKQIPAGVFHSFTGTADQVKIVRETGDFYFGINGIVTFKKADLDDMVREVGLDRIVLETDAPYLAPVPFRGKRNEPSYLPFMAKKLAEIFDIDMAEIGRRTTINASMLFGL